MSSRQISVSSERPMVTRRSFLRLAGAAGAAATVPGLAACGDDDGGSSGGGSGGKKTVVVASWHWKETGGMEKWWALCKQRFQDQHPNITIEERYVPYNNYFNQAYVEMGTGNPADIYSIAQPASYVMMRNGLVEPLNQYLEGTSIRQDFSPVIDTEPCSTDGQIYVLPMNQVTGAYLYYDKRWLEQAGVAVPTTPDAYFAAAQKLAGGGKFGGLLDTSTADSLYQQLLMTTIGFGGLWWDREKGGPTVTTPEVVQAMTWYKSVIDSGVVPKQADYISHNQLFFEGRGAMMWNGTFSLPQIQQNNPDLAANLGVAPLPWQNGRTWLSILGCVIAKNSKTKDEAWQFLQFMGSKEMQTEFLNLTNTPTSFNLEISDELKAKMPHLEVFRSPLSTEPFLYRAPKGMEDKAAQFFKIFTDGAQKFLYGSAGIEPTLADVQKKLEALA